MKFIQATQRGGNRIGLLYRVTNGNYFSMANWMDQKLVNCAPNREETEYMGYISATIGGKQNPVMRLLAVLEIFGLASYEVRGGQNLEIFVRVNDPQSVRIPQLQEYAAGRDPPPSCGCGGNDALLPDQRPDQQAALGSGGGLFPRPR